MNLNSTPLENEQREYIIKDVYSGLDIARGNLFLLWFIGFVVSMIYLLVLKEDYKTVCTYITMFNIIILIQSLIMYRCNSFYRIDKEGFVTFPRTDVENSIFQIIILLPYWNLMRTRTVHISEVENVYLTGTRTNHLDVAGTFGSCRFEFSNKQKRNEVRNALTRAAKTFTNINLDNSVNPNI